MAKGKLPCLHATRWRGLRGARSSRALASQVGHHPDGTPLPARGPAVPLVQTELKRRKYFDSLKRKLKDWCSSNGCKRYPSLAFERWWYSAMSFDHQDDPLLPVPASSQDPALLADLVQVGFAEAEAQEMIRRLHSSSSAAARNLVKLKDEAPLMVEVQHLDGEEVLLSCQEVSVRLTLPAYKKLQQLYQLNSSKEADASASFHQAALVLALRYQSLGGVGFQLALPPSAWKVLEEDFGVQAECFASPLNCWFPNYCSAFPDCDGCFGSLGNFFSFHPRRGSFEVNPPFAPKMIAQTREHLHRLLESSEPLRFVLAVAHWNHPEVEALKSSPFLKGSLVVDKEQQVWMDGPEKRRAPVELLLLVLQNDAAEPVSPEQLERLRQSCTGEAKPLGPRKRPLQLPETTMEVPATSAAAEGEVGSEPGTKPLLRPPRPPRPPRPGGVLWRKPHWKRVKLKRLTCWRRLHDAAKSFAWTTPITDGWHARNMRFWAKEAATLDGMTGGGVSDLDLAFNQKFLRRLCRARGNAKGRFACALDVGAGIGRLAQHLLRPHCDAVDLLEPVEKHLETAKRTLVEHAWPGHFYGCTLQDFGRRMGARCVYDLVWCQWVLMYITDRDVVAFLQRLARRSLAPAGTVVVKENVAQERVGSYFDDEEGELWRGAVASRPSQPMSVLRTPQHYVKLFRESGFEVVMRRRQFFSDDEMPMMLFTLALPNRPEQVHRAAVAARSLRAS